MFPSKSVCENELLSFDRTEDEKNLVQIENENDDFGNGILSFDDKENTNKQAKGERANMEVEPANSCQLTVFKQIMPLPILDDDVCEALVYIRNFCDD